MRYTSFQVLKIYLPFTAGDDHGLYSVKVKLIGERTKKVYIYLDSTFPNEEIIKKAVDEYIEEESIDALNKSWIESMIGRVFNL